MLAIDKRDEIKQDKETYSCAALAIDKRDEMKQDKETYFVDESSCAAKPREG